jgi:hypothetical protein
MAPVDSVGEWIGLLGGLMTLSLVVFVIAGAIFRPFSPIARTIVHGIDLRP